MKRNKKNSNIHPTVEKYFVAFTFFSITKAIFKLSHNNLVLFAVAVWLLRRLALCKLKVYKRLRYSFVKLGDAFVDKEMLSFPKRVKAVDLNDTNCDEVFFFYMWVRNAFYMCWRALFASPISFCHRHSSVNLPVVNNPVVSILRKFATCP